MDGHMMDVISEQFRNDLPLSYQSYTKSNLSYANLYQGLGKSTFGPQG